MTKDFLQLLFYFYFISRIQESSLNLVLQAYQFIIIFIPDQQCIQNAWVVFAENFYDDVWAGFHGEF